MLDGKEGDNVQGVDIDCCTILSIRDLDADVADTAYASLDLIGKHQIIAHRMEEYVREVINGIEAFWSYAKTWLYNYQGRVC